MEVVLISIDKYLGPLWSRYGLVGVVVVVLLGAALAWFFKLDVGALVEVLF